MLLCILSIYSIQISQILFEFRYFEKNIKDVINLVKILKILWNQKKRIMNRKNRSIVLFHNNLILNLNYKILSSIFNLKLKNISQKIVFKKKRKIKNTTGI